MPRPRQLPDLDILVSHRRDGWSYQDIADEYGVTVGAVYLQLKQAKATKARPSYKHLIPWKVKTEHAHSHPAMMLRLLGRTQTHGLESLPEVKQRLLTKWLKEMEEANVVVCYHPDQPPNRASPRTGGFYYKRRRSTDGTSLVREHDVEVPVQVCQN